MRHCCFIAWAFVRCALLTHTVAACLASLETNCLLALKGCWLMVRSGLTMIRINRRQQQWVTREVVTAISFFGIQIIELFFFCTADALWPHAVLSPNFRIRHQIFCLLLFFWCFRLLLSQVRCTGRKLTTCSVLFRWSFFLSWRDGTGAEFLLAFACASRDGDDVGTRMCCFGAGGMDRDTEST